MDELLDRIRRGDRRSLAGAMSLVDRPGRPDRKLENSLRRSTGRVPWWGITGPPGVGKSTLIDALLGELRDRGRRVGVVAIDPTSPFSTGALLGDRVRMMRHAVDQSIFIRSLATHGREGGLSDAAVHCARLLELASFDPVLIETVGVGQNEVDISWVADICTVVLAPGFGDEIQVIKAGLLEIPDILVVNKCDLPESDRLLGDLRAQLDVTTSQKNVEIIGVEAKSGKGVDQLLEALLELDSAARAEEQSERRRHRRTLGEIRRGSLLACERAWEAELTGPEARELVARFERGELSIDSVIERLATAILTEHKKPAADTGD